MNALPSISVILRKATLRDGLSPICLRIIFQRNPYVKSLGIKVHASNFKPNAEQFKYIGPGDANYIEKNALIQREVLLLEKRFLELATIHQVTGEHVKRIVDNKAAAGSYFFEVATSYIQTVSNAGTVRRWGHCLNLIHRYQKGVLIHEIDKYWLHKFEDFLKLKYSNANSRLAPLKFIRAVINFARERGNTMPYPFGRDGYTLPGEEKRLRNYLTQAQVEKLKELLVDNTSGNMYNTLQWFLFQCETGMRYSDLEVFSAKLIRANTIYFADVKTATPHAIPLNPRIEKLLPIIYTLPLPKYENYKRHLQAAGMAIKLPFKLTSHVGRHTFAVQWLEDGGDIYKLQAMLGHSDLKMTMIYAKITPKGLRDEMKRIRG